MIDRADQYLVFLLEGQRYAIALSHVEKVIRAVQVIALPQSSGSFFGLINLRGRIIPIFDIRRQLQLPMREMKIEDRIIVARTDKGTFSFIVDDVLDVLALPSVDTLEAKDVLPGTERHIRGVGKADGRAILIYNAESLTVDLDLEKLQEATYEHA